MAEKGFGVKEVNLIGASGTPTITSPNNLNLNANNVAISTNVSIGGTLSVTGNVSVGGTLTYEDVTNIDSVGLITARSGLIISGVTTFNTDVDFKGSGGATKILYDASQDALEFADSATLAFGSHPGTGDYQINYVNGGDFAINAMSGGSQDLVIGRYESATQKKHLVSTRAGVIELYHDNAKKLETNSTGVNVTGAITVNGSALSIDPTNSDIQVAYNVTANGSSAYRFAGNGVVSSTDNPDLYLIRGQKYRFINNSGGSHPFQIREASGGTAYSTGVTNNGASSGNIDFAPTYDSPAQLVYQCTSHGGMVGNIYLRDAAGGNTNVGVTTATAFIPTQEPLSNRNVIINGSMLISQRGSDFTGVNSSAYHLDRWYWYDQNSSCEVRIRHSGDAPDGFHQSYRVNVTTADTSIASNEEVKLYQKIEGFNLQRFAKGTSGAKAFALSFYIKCNKNGTYIVELYDRDNGRDVSGSYTVSNSNWNRHTIIFPADTTGEFDFDHSSSLEISWWLVAGSDTNSGTLGTTWAASADSGSATGQVNFTDSTSNEWMLAGVQLETDFVTPFEHIQYGDELARCQRYYQKLSGAALTYYGVGNVDGGTMAQILVNFITEMRSAPGAMETSGTASDYSIRMNSNATGSSVPTLSNRTTKNAMVIFYASGHGFTNGQACFGRAANNTNGFLAFSAEL